MNKWELARYIIDGKKSVDTVRFLVENGSKVSNIDIRQEVNDAKQKFYVSICVVMDNAFQGRKRLFVLTSLFLLFTMSVIRTLHTKTIIIQPKSTHRSKKLQTK